MFENIKNSIQNIGFPATKDEVVNFLKNNRVSQEIISVVEKIEDKVYETKEDLSEAIKKVF